MSQADSSLAHGRYFSAVDAFCVNGEQHVDAMTGLFGNLGWQFYGVQPGRYARVAQVVRTSCQRRVELLVGESSQPGVVPRAVHSLHGDGFGVWPGEGYSGCPGARHEQVAIATDGVGGQMALKHGDQLWVSGNESSVSDCSMLELALLCDSSVVSPSLTD